MTIWFTADTHFNHKLFVEHKLRPFDSVEEMNETLITLWNQCVARGDLIYHLGDFGFMRSAEDTEAILDRLNGNKHLIWGNHDRDEVRKARHWSWQGERKFIKIGDQYVVLDHYPGMAWKRSHIGAWQLHGHIHGQHIGVRPYQTDVGVDAVTHRTGSPRPVSFEEIQKEMSKWDGRVIFNGKEPIVK